MSQDFDFLTKRYKSSGARNLIDMTSGKSLGVFLIDANENRAIGTQNSIEFQGQKKLNWINQQLEVGKVRGRKPYAPT